MEIAEQVLAVLAFIAALASFADTKRHALWVRVAVLLATLLLILLAFRVHLG